MLEICEVSKKFGDLQVMERFSLTVPESGFTALVGPSGCGKSTLFDLLTGVVARDGGSIRWKGDEVPDLGSLAAYMQQKDLLLPWLSLFENAMLPARVAGEGDSRSGEARALLKHLGLEGFAHYLPGAVSGGMRQRCALVRTLMFGREIVLLDEPLSALDAITRRSLHAVLLLLQTEFRKTLLMITHDVEEALLLADEVIVLSRPPMAVRERFRPESPKPRRITDPGLVRLKEHILTELEAESNAL